MSRNASVRSGICVVFCGLISWAFLAGCGGGSTPSSTPPSISVSVSPTTASLSGGGTQAFAVTVANDSSNSGVTWSIGSGVGAISASTATSVTYTAPSMVSATNAVTLTATSNTDKTKSTSATITLTPPSTPPAITSVSASCKPTSLQTGATSQCTAAVTGTGGYSSAVTWSVATVPSGNSTVGTINNAGLYTAPGAVPTPNLVSITATSTEDTTKSGSTSVTITAALQSIQVTPAFPSIAVTQTQQFTATGTYSDSSTQNITSSVTWSSSSTPAATINGSGLATSVAGGTTTIKAASGSVNGSTSLIVTATAGTVSPAAGVTDSNGLTTLVSNGLTVPVQLTDQDTGNPMAGASVALGTDPGVPGSAILIVADPTGVHPLQMTLLNGPPALITASGRVKVVAVRQSALGSAQPRFGGDLQANTTPSPTAVAASTGCPSGSGLTASNAISLSNIPVPPSPISTAGVQSQAIDALNALTSLDPKNIPPGYYGPISVSQFPVTGQCLKDIGGIVAKEAGENIALLILDASVPIIAPAIEYYDTVSVMPLTVEVMSTFKTCSYDQIGNPVLNITSVCGGPGAGVNCILIPQLEFPPAPPTSQQLGSDYAMQGVVVNPPAASSETYIQSGNLGGMVVGTTDGTGKGQVEVPLGPNTVCADASGYQQYTQPGFIVSAPGSPLDVNLTPQGHAQVFSGTYSAPFSGTAPDPNGGSYSASADFNFSFSLTENSDGTINGTANVPTNINIAVVSCPSGDTCSPNSFAATATGSVTGSNGNITASLSNGATNPFRINVTGDISGTSITLTGGFSDTLVGTGTDGPPISTLLSGTITGGVVTKQ